MESHDVNFSNADSEKYAAAVEKARAWIDSRDKHYLDATSPVDVLSESTIHMYAQFNRRRHRVGNQIIYESSTRTRAVYRAAWRHEIDLELRVLLEMLGDDRSGSHDHVLSKISDHVETLEALDEESENFAKAAREVSRVTGKKNNQKRKTKRSSLQMLPADCDLQILNAVRKSRRKCPHEKALQVLFMTGVRPAELEIGVHVRRLEDTLRFTITGAKRSVLSKSGQDYRIMDFPADHPLAKGLAVKGPEVVSVANAKRLTDTVRWYVEKLWPDLRTKVSAYSFRHRFASILKQADEPVKTIAKAMGHQAEVSQQVYGSRSTGRKFFKNAAKLIDVVAPQKVREPKLKTCKQAESAADQGNLENEQAGQIRAFRS